MKFKALALAGMAAVAGSAFGWDIGHETVAMAVLAKLPEKWRNRVAGELLRDFREAAKLPDWGDMGLLGPDRQWFAAHGVTTSIGLHHAKRYPFYMNRLVDAINKDDVRRVAVLLASLSHTISDDAACNHDPLTHMLTYVWGPNGYGVMPAVKVDFGWVDLDEDAHEVLRRRVAELQVPNAREETYEQFISRSLLWPLEGGEVALKHSAQLCDACIGQAVSGTPAASRKLAEALCDIGFWGVERTLEFFAAAERFATIYPDGAPDLDCEAFAKTVDIDTPFMTRDWHNDSAAREYMPKPGRAYRIRVLYEPTEHCSAALMTALSRVMAPPIVATLRKNFPAEGTALLDLREFIRDGLNAVVSPLLVLQVNRVLEKGSHCGMNREMLYGKLAEYAKSGGRIVFIEGPLPEEACPELVPAFRTAPDYGLLPGESSLVRRARLPVPPDCVLNSSMTVETAEGPRTWTFRRDVALCAGWMSENSRHWFDLKTLPTGTAKEIVRMNSVVRNVETNLTVGVVAPAEKPTFAYLPNSIVFPYILTDEKPQLSPYNWTLDSAGEAAVVRAVELILPDAVKYGANVNPPYLHRSVFDGKSLKGWKVVSGDWILKPNCDGMAFGNVGAGKVVTDFDVGDFELELDFRMDGVPAGMTGIRVRDTTFLLFKDPHLNASCGMYDPKTGDSKVLSGGDRPLGEWNRLYIRCIGRKIRAMLNGRYAVDFEKMIEATGSGVVKYRGPLSIESAGAPLSFRNVYLRNR